VTKRHTVACHLRTAAEIRYVPVLLWTVVKCI